MAAHENLDDRGQLQPIGSSVARDGSAVAVNFGDDSAASAGSTTSSTNPPVQRPTTRSQHDIVKPKIYTDGTVRWCNLATTEEPTTVGDALHDKKWIAAMDEEHYALVQNGTWRLVPPPKGKIVIDCKWVYKIKRRADGQVERYKAWDTNNGMELIMKTPSVRLSKLPLFVSSCLWLCQRGGHLDN